MNKFRLNLHAARKILLSVFFVTIVFAAGYLVGYKGYVARLNPYPDVTIDRQLPEDKQTLNFSLFWDVWDVLGEKYFDKSKLIESKMVYGSIQGMVAAIGDPYTVFLPPKENKVVQEDLSGSFEGVGIQIGFKGTQLAVIAPLADSPAEEAGVKAGDFIINIKDDNKGIDMGTVGISLPDAVQAIRGPRGTQVTLTLLRDDSDKAIEAEIIREPIEVPSVALDFVDSEGEFDEEGGNIAYIRVLKFVTETKKEWDEAIIEVLKRDNLDGIVVDVRNNPGGYLQGAVDLASDILEVGDLVVVEEQSGGRDREFRVENIGRLRNENIVVLINSGSASASEIFAGALRDNENTPLVGQTSFGKGTIQEPHQVDGGAGLHITVARWLTPSGFWVNDGGIVPDVEVEDDTETSGDEQLIEAIKLIEGN
jgi:carboxyl-terminal processing protease